MPGPWLGASTAPQNIATTQVTPTTTAATLIASRAKRFRVTFYNNGSCDCWIGPATVTTANSTILPAGMSYVSYSSALFQAILASGTTMTGGVHILEEYFT